MVIEVPVSAYRVFQGFSQPEAYGFMGLYGYGLGQSRASGPPGMFRPIPGAHLKALHVSQMLSKHTSSIILFCAVS
jgi:hypothetical protein